MNIISGLSNQKSPSVHIEDQAKLLSPHNTEAKKANLDLDNDSENKGLSIKEVAKQLQDDTLNGNKT